MLEEHYKSNLRDTFFNLFEILEIQRTTLGKGPFVFNLGHGIVPQTALAHVAELSALIKNWRA